MEGIHKWSWVSGKYTLRQSLDWISEVLGLAMKYPLREMCKICYCWRGKFASNGKKKNIEGVQLFVVGATSDGHSL